MSVWNAADLSVRTRGKLPHWERPDGCYFVTFRLADSLPAEVRDRLRLEADSLRKTPGTAADARSLTLARRRVFGQMERHLDQGAGACFMAKPEIAQLVAETLQFRAGSTHDLFAWVIMPNHVHAVVHLHEGTNLASLLHSWKSFTAQRANAILRRRGKAFWQREYYDHLIRSDSDLWGCVRYIASNPERAGLTDWPWVWVHQEWKEM